MATFDGFTIDGKQWYSVLETDPNNLWKKTTAEIKEDCNWANKLTYVEHSKDNPWEQPFITNGLTKVYTNTSTPEKVIPFEGIIAGTKPSFEAKLWEFAADTAGLVTETKQYTTFYISFASSECIDITYADGRIAQRLEAKNFRDGILPKVLFVVLQGAGGGGRHGGALTSGKDCGGGGGGACIVAINGNIAGSKKFELHVGWGGKGGVQGEGHTEGNEGGDTTLNYTYDIITAKATAKGGGGGKEDEGGKGGWALVNSANKRCIFELACISGGDGGWFSSAEEKTKIDKQTIQASNAEKDKGVSTYGLGGTVAGDTPNESSLKMGGGGGGPSPMANGGDGDLEGETATKNGTKGSGGGGGDVWGAFFWEKHSDGGNGGGGYVAIYY